MEINITIDISKKSAVLLASLMFVLGAATANVMVKDPGPLEVFTTLDMQNNGIKDVDWTSSDAGSGSQLDADLLDGEEGSHYEDGAISNCGSGELLTGDGSCTTGSGSTQNLEQVLTQGNTARSHSIIIDRVYADDQNVGGTPAISVAVGEPDTGLNSDTTGRLEFWTGNSERMALTSSGLDMKGNSVKNPGEVQDSSGNTMVNYDDSNRDVEINDNTGFQLPVGADAY